MEEYSELQADDLCDFSFQYDFDIPNLDYLLPVNIQPLIEIRLKLKNKDSKVIKSGELLCLQTSCVIETAISNYSLYLQGNKTLNLLFENDGFLSQGFSGRIVIKLRNFNPYDILLEAGLNIAELWFSPFSND